MRARRPASDEQPTGSMMSTLADIRDRAIATVKDDSGKLAVPDDYDRNINAAVNRYSRHRPNIQVSDIAGNGTHDYSLPAGWSDGFSVASKIEYPIGDVPATLLDNDEYELYQSPTGMKLRLKHAAPSATQSFRLTFTTPRLVTTIPDGDVDAFIWLAASLCCEDLANAFAQTSDTTIAADSVNYRTKAQEFTSMAKRLMQIYKEHMGLKDDDLTTLASAVTDVSLNYPGGRDRLTHPRWARKSR